MAVSADDPEVTQISSSFSDQPAVDDDIVRKWQIMQLLSSSFSAGKRLFGNDMISFAPVEALLLLYIVALDGSALTIHELAEKAKLAEPAMARWITALEHRELVEIVQKTLPAETVTIRITQDCVDKIDAIISDLTPRH